MSAVGAQNFIDSLAPFFLCREIRIIALQQVQNKIE